MNTTLLIPTDFSETAENALNYGVALANYFSANIILLHVESTPLYVTDSEVLSYTTIENTVSSLDLLKESATKIRKENILVGDVGYFVEEGDLKTVVTNYINEKKIDFVVMGITGHSTKIGKTLFGSNAVSLSKESSVPVFIIPRNYHYKKINNIAYACEYDTNIKEQTGLIQIKYINTLFDGELSVLHVIPSKHIIDRVESETDFYVEEKLENVHHKTFILSEDNVIEALLNFIKTHNIDIIVLEQKKHSFLHNLLYQSATKEIAFNSPVPVLTIKS